MVGRSCVAFVAVALLVGCGGPEVPVKEPLNLVALLPAASELAGSTVSDGPVVHTPATLFEHLNGGAERYLAHGFHELLHLLYELGDGPLNSVTLDVYDMGSELGAFGVYAAARPPGVEVRLWGAEGYRVGTTAAAWKGAVYVHGEADDDRSDLIALLEALVAGVCERAPGEASMPAVLAALPEGGREPQSERYVPADLLGHAFLPGGVLATYEIEGRRAELYLCDLSTDVAAGKALESLREHLSRWGTVDHETQSIGTAGFRYTEPTLGSGTVVRAGRFLGGIHGDQSAEERERTLAELLAALASN